MTIRALAVCSLLMCSGTALAGGDAAYATYCATCHGAAGAGDGPVAAGLNPKPADFTTAEFWESTDDATVKKAIMDGGTAIGKSPLMPPQKGVIASEAELDALLVYLKSLRKSE